MDVNELIYQTPYPNITGTNGNNSLSEGTLVYYNGGTWAVSDGNGISGTFETVKSPKKKFYTEYKKTSEYKNKGKKKSIFEGISFKI